MACRVLFFAFHFNECALAGKKKKSHGMAILVALDTFSSYNRASAVCSAEWREPLPGLPGRGRAVGSAPAGMAVLPDSPVRGQAFAFPIIFRCYKILI